MAFQGTEAGQDGGPALLVKIAGSGCIRTRKDAEAFRDHMLRNGYEKDYLPLYRAVLAILGDMSALNLSEPQHSVATTAYLGMKKWYIGDSECRCLRNATGGVLVNVTTCPVHGEMPGAKLGMRNLTGMIR